MFVRLIGGLPAPYKFFFLGCTLMVKNFVLNFVGWFCGEDWGWIHKLKPQTNLVTIPVSKVPAIEKERTFTMNPMFAVVQSRVAINYAAQIGITPEALPPGTIATIINVLLPILLKFMGTCTGTGTPPTTGSKAIIEHCQNGGSIMAHFRVIQQIRRNGGLDSSMDARAVARSIFVTGAQSTPEEIDKFVLEMSDN